MDGAHRAPRDLFGPAIFLQYPSAHLGHSPSRKRNQAAGLDSFLKPAAEGAAYDDEDMLAKRFLLIASM
jgi:hypothetical protein